MGKDNDFLIDFLGRSDSKMSEETMDILMPNLKIIQAPKKHVIIRENQKSDFAFVIIKGAARSFYLHDGLEINTWFAFEDEVVGSLRSYNDLPSRETVQMLEDSVLVSFNMKEIKELMKSNLEIANFINPVIRDYAVYLEDKLYFTHLRSAKEKFTNLMIRNPEIFQRVSLTYIASFLGISRETLSRLRSH